MINKNILDININCFIYKFGILQHFRIEELEKYKLLFNTNPFVHHLAGQNKEKIINV
jgi:hypothetical protein